MIILDENIPDSQRLLLRSWRIKVYQIGHDISRQGIKDEEIIPLLHHLKSVTFFTRDIGFYNRRLCHTDYCLVCLAVNQYEAASFIRRLLKHSDFNTKIKRMGKVVRLTHIGLKVWRRYAEKEEDIKWLL
jgi:hypothetical protein